MTTKNTPDDLEICPMQKLLKLFSGKLKPEIFLLATKSTLRFNSLLRELEGSNKQSLSIALRDLTEAELLKKIIISKKPLHIEYHLTEKGRSLIPVFNQLEGLF
ncbi:winged helix-turn-helix transcriptional regulator [Epilithonimonas hungarica]|uniref:Transcriptional regulator, HxlR family n=1 Tax=Epilithonimonas hungarica TaxID=454006 RepID=A0A1G7H8V1_9FLAO|nr:helix-turn-helix domain-containing protein [Epilithonimonas hungarica]MDP9956576.1 DNA-binding HxlR family transcriptional regulator [Epilithonimonas hungarica]MPT31439.1 transcriptional regulator [Chryseobacterium sp.]SDE96872.1 transcriptional regulator, HxlR family [Epilithonimonas hungarica]